jgi:tetratricopeptide (TPR) repeat protein
MVLQESERERRILERILSLKQRIKDGDSGPIELHELGVCYFYLSNFRQAAEYLHELLELFPDYVEIGAAHALRALALVNAEDYAEAERALRARLGKSAGDVRLMGMLAHVLYRTGRLDEAIEQHRRILRLDADNLNSLNSLGYLLALRDLPEDRDEAYACLKRAVARKPEHPAYLDSLGVLLARSGDRERARRALFKALERAPENAEILDHIRDLLPET